MPLFRTDERTDMDPNEWLDIEQVSAELRVAAYLAREIIKERPHRGGKGRAPLLVQRKELDSWTPADLVEPIKPVA